MSEAQLETYRAWRMAPALRVLLRLHNGQVSRTASAHHPLHMLAEQGLE